MPRFGPLVLLVLTLLFATTARGASDRTLAQYHHTRWTLSEGAPGQISALAQTPDGYLWVAAASSLYRFDGVRFEQREPPTGRPFTTIQTMFVDASGGLWLGFQRGGIALYQAGRVNRFEGTDAPSVQPTSFAQTRDGVIWVTASKSGLYRYERGRWTKITASGAYDGGDAYLAFTDREGTLWLSDGKRLLRMPPGQDRFVDSGVAAGWAFQMRQSPDGTLWISEHQGGVRPVWRRGPIAPSSAPGFDIESAGVQFGRDGDLWIASLGDGLFRVQQPAYAPGTGPAAPERFAKADGLSSNYAWPLLIDREGSVWVGTSGGLDRFRPNTFRTAPFDPGAHDFALAFARDGALWAGTSNRPLMRLVGETVQEFDLGQPVRSAYTDYKGETWLGADGTLYRVVDGKPRVEAPFENPRAQVQAMARAGDGALWVVLTRGGLMRLSEGRWVPPPKPMPFEGPVRPAALAESKRGLWLGMSNGDVYLISGRDMVRTQVDSVARTGGVVSLVEHGDTLWIGGQFGVATLRDGKVQRLEFESKEPIRGIGAILPMKNGDVWLHSMAGVVHVPVAEIDRARTRPGYRMAHRLYDFLDGLPGRPTNLRPLPTAARGPDGRLWFATSDGTVWLRPGDRVRNAIAPSVAVLAVRNDKGPLPEGQLVDIGSNARDVEIDYTALSLAMPERVNFRVRLLGSEDERWHDVGTRRTAYFDTLPPGEYRFQVVASNNDGVWNLEGDEIRLKVAPTFVQSAGFRVMVVAILVILAWLAYLARIRQIARTVEDRLRAQNAERERIARELHDTLLQSVQGLLLRFQAVSDQLPPSSAHREALESALDVADEVVAEARDRVASLRALVRPAAYVHDAIAAVGNELAATSVMSFTMTVHGDPHPLRDECSDEIYFIAREALLNAFQHARGSSVEGEVAYLPDAIQIRIADDGRGIPTEIAQQGRRSGHWGLVGMRERARELGADMSVLERPGGGSIIQLDVPLEGVCAPPARMRLPWRASAAAR